MWAHRAAERLGLRSGQRTVADTGHGGHPEVGAVLVVESVAVSIHRVVEVRVIPIQEGGGQRGRCRGQGEQHFQSPLFPDHLLCADSVLEPHPGPLTRHHPHFTREEARAQRDQVAAQGEQRA